MDKFPDAAQVEQIHAWRRQRFHDEDDAKERSEQERDADRIWYSAALMRLQGVVQVVSAPRRIMFHNRYTHSVKVALLARRMAERLHKTAFRDYGANAEAFLAALGGLDCNVAEAAGLGHDLGHPPFGHHGEVILDSLASPGGFNGNAQTFRVVTQLAVRDVYPGLNLTRSTLLALVKYPWARSQEAGRDKRWGYYANDKPTWEWLLKDRPDSLLSGVGDGTQPSLEAQIMDWADDVTYAVHDVEDFFKAGVIPLYGLKHPERWEDVIEQGLARADGAFGSTSRQDLDDAAARVTRLLRSLLVGLDEPFDGSSQHEALLTLMASELIGKYSRAASLRTPTTADPLTLAVDPEARAEVLLLKELAWYYVISRPGLAGIQYGQATLLARLHADLKGSVQKLSNASAGVPLGDGPGDIRLVPPQGKERLQAKDDVGTVARDLLASMSEDQVRDLSARWYGEDAGSALDPIF